MAHIALTAYELETGGISRVAVDLSNGFAEAGHKVSLILCSGAGEHDFALRGEIASGVDIVTLSPKRYARRFIGQAATFPAMRRWLASNRPDVLLGTANNIAWFTGLARAALDGARPKLFIKTTNPILRKADGPLLTNLRRWGYNRLFAACDAVLTLSEAESRLLSTHFPAQAARFSAVFNPYLTQVFVDAAARRPRNSEAESDGPLMLVLGRLAAQKNTARAIRAFARARQNDVGGKLANARLIIAGEGPLRDELERLVVEVGLTGAVTIAGFSNRVPALLRQADRLLLSSEYEGLPAVVIEALGSGCAVVATDCFPAARELLVGLPGCRLCDFSDEAMAEALLASLAEPVDSDILRARALDYRPASAIASHLNAIGLSRHLRSPRPL